MKEVRSSPARRRGRASLVRSSGPLAGLRYFLGASVTTLGRNQGNEIVLHGPDIAVVSGRHAEIEEVGGVFRIRDLASTNGTFVDGSRITDAELTPPCTIQLGAGGPELLLTFDDEPAPEPLNETLVVSEGVLQNADVTDAPASGDEALLRQAVAQARVARSTGRHGQTMTIMREVIDTALGRTRRRFRAIILALAIVLIAVITYSAWQIHVLRESKDAIDAQIRTLEGELARVSEDAPEADQIINTLQRYQDQGRAIQQNLFYRLSDLGKEEFIRREIRTLLAEFGAEAYSVPPEFVEQVHRYIRRYQGPDRPHMARAMGELRPSFDGMRRALESRNLPPDLAYMALAESGLENGGVSSAGAAGVWQFTPATARAYGLQVGGGTDERLNAVKSTRAAARYIRELILEFGAGSSVMLAMAAYNVGPSQVKSAIHKLVNDPIKQRNFWYLYRRRALPAETREYVPKVIAAMIIGRNPQRFGF
ncbi:MAG TPA: transglycosylase SLT domain-containing protein [Bryobacteraceae bacterium]|nr:transglycosylase SLT domain-containing protein [Bryobacteraceae bacterium]